MTSHNNEEIKIPNLVIMIICLVKTSKSLQIEFPKVARLAATKCLEIRLA